MAAEIARLYDGTVHCLGKDGLAGLVLAREMKDARGRKRRTGFLVRLFLDLARSEQAPR